MKLVKKEKIKNDKKEVPPKWDWNLNKKKEPQTLSVNVEDNVKLKEELK